MFNYFTSAFWLDSPLWFPLELSCDDPLTQLSGGATNGETMPCKPVSKGTNLTTRPTNFKLMKNSMKNERFRLFTSDTLRGKHGLRGSSSDTRGCYHTLDNQVHTLGGLCWTQLSYFAQREKMTYHQIFIYSTTYKPQTELINMTTGICWWPRS